MSDLGAVRAADVSEADDDMLTRTEASAYLARFNVILKPSTLARIWSVGGDGPPCQHIRKKPFYPRGVLRVWAESQRTDLRQANRARVMPPLPGADP